MYSSVRDSSRFTSSACKHGEALDTTDVSRWLFLAAAAYLNHRLLRPLSPNLLSKEAAKTHSCVHACATRKQKKQDSKHTRCSCWTYLPRRNALHLHGQAHAAGVLLQRRVVQAHALRGQSPRARKGPAAPPIWHPRRPGRRILGLRLRHPRGLARRQEHHVPAAGASRERPAHAAAHGG